MYGSIFYPPSTPSLSYTQNIRSQIQNSAQKDNVPSWRCRMKRFIEIDFHRQMESQKQILSKDSSKNPSFSYFYLIHNCLSHLISKKKGSLISDFTHAILKNTINSSVYLARCKRLPYNFGFSPFKWIPNNWKIRSTESACQFN